jgi:transposase InsO family protein
MCERYDVTRGGYYAWRRRPASVRDEQDRQLLKRIMAIHAASDGTYGSPRIHRALQQAGVAVARKRVARLMRQNELRARALKLYRRHPGTRIFFLGIPNRARLHQVTGSDQIWVGDITYLRLNEHWVYLAAVMDLYSRRIVGWSLGTDRDARLTIRALNRAAASRQPKTGLIFHSDRGIEYAAYEFRTRLAALGIEQSMNRRGRPTDNAHMESFFHSMKSDVIHGCRFTKIDELREVVRRYIAFYNQRRLHSSLDYRSPVDYENAAA